MVVVVGASQVEGLASRQDLVRGSCSLTFGVSPGSVLALVSCFVAPAVVGPKTEERPVGGKLTGDKRSEHFGHRSRADSNGLRVGRVRWGACAVALLSSFVAWGGRHQRGAFTMMSLARGVA